MGTFVLEVLSYPMFACPVPFLHIPLIDRLEFPAFLVAFLLAIMSLFFTLCTSPVADSNRDMSNTAKQFVHLTLYEEKKTKII